MDHSFYNAQRSIRPSTKLIIFSIISIALLVLDGRYSAVQQAKKYASTLLYPLQWLAKQPIAWLQYGHSFVQTQDDLLIENQKLLAENTRLKMEAQRFTVQARELTALRALALLRENGLASGTTAEIISNGKEPLPTQLIINKGEKHGLHTGDAIIDEFGLVGQIKQVRALTSEITLLTDSKMVIPVMIARTGVRTLVHGNGNDLALRFFPTDADLQPNDVLVTSGLDSVFPVGLPVARVLQTNRNAGTPFYRVKLDILAAVRSSKYVLVLPQMPSIVEAHSPSETPQHE